MKQVVFFDTTLRDGQQQAGIRFSPDEKVRLAHQLASLGVNIVETGFTIASEEDFHSAKRISQEVDGIVVCSLARVLHDDIQKTAQALEHARNPPRIHTFIATSDIHLEHKLCMSRTQALDAAVSAVECARSYVDDVQFSAEDATRSDFGYLASVVREVILAGARTVNLPDTVGYCMPQDIQQMIVRMHAEVPEIAEYGVVISVHCHDDLGCAVANTLAGISAGARQVECTINGIGERAGNTHYAPVAMALTTREDFFGMQHTLRTQKIGNTSRLVSEITSKKVSDNFPVVGMHAFAHASGIHAHGSLRHQETYQIMTPASVGWEGEQYPLSLQSGKTGLAQRLERVGYVVGENEMPSVYQAFLVRASEVSLLDDTDLHALMRAVRGS